MCLYSVCVCARARVYVCVCVCDGESDFSGPPRSITTKLTITMYFLNLLDRLFLKKIIMVVPIECVITYFLRGKTYIRELIALRKRVYC